MPDRRTFRRLVVSWVVVALAGAVPIVGAGDSGAVGLPKFPSASWSTTIGPTHLSSPVIADVTGDGHPDVVTSDLSGMLHVLDGRTGRDLPGWPQPIQIIPGQTVASESSPTVDDLDNNGRMTIIVGAGSLNVPGQQGGVEAFNANGTVRWRIQTQTVAGESGVVGTPAVGDVNGDGYPDVVFGSWDHNIYVVNRFGQALPGFPFNSLDTIWDSPALYDEAHIGRMDIFLGGDASPGGPCGNLSWAGILRAIRVTPSGPKILWSHCQHQIFQSSPAIGDLEGNGRMDLVVGTGTGPSGDAVATNSLSAFHLNDGSPVPGWPVLLNGPIFGSPVIGDITGSGQSDVVVTACAACTDGRVWAFNGHGGLMWDMLAPNDHTEILSTPILVDLDGDGVNDVAVGQAGQFYLLRGRDGAPLYQSIEINRVVQNSAAVADFGPGYGWRLVIQSWLPQGDGQPQSGSGRVDSFPLPKAPAVAPAWPQWRGNAAHTGSPSTAPANAGYWLVSSAGGIFSYGNAHYYGSTGAWHLRQPIVGMAATPSGRGYWLVARNGAVFSFGDAHWYGSASAKHLSQPVVGIARTPSGHGYWLVTRNGNVFAFGDARLHGSTVARRLAHPIVGIAPSRSGHGYWLVGQTGSIFPFGDAQWHGSVGLKHLGQPIVSMVATPSGNGYWLVGRAGHVFAFGDAHDYGSRPQGLPVPVVALTRTSTGLGYWLVGQNGDIFPFGDAQFYAPIGGVPTNQSIETAVASRHS
ncbi:MAG: FG-GAP repeat domain-containing protein [Acidimicrobiia bacterium]